MKEIASTASFMRFRVAQKIFASWAGPTPSKRPATIAAKKQPVPVAESQLKSYRAASGVSLVTTGAARLTALCRNGTSQTGVVAQIGRASCRERVEEKECAASCRETW